MLPTPLRSVLSRHYLMYTVFGLIFAFSGLFVVAYPLVSQAATLSEEEQAIRDAEESYIETNGSLGLVGEDTSSTRVIDEEDKQLIDAAKQYETDNATLDILDKPLPVATPSAEERRIINGEKNYTSTHDGLEYTDPVMSAKDQEDRTVYESEQSFSQTNDSLDIVDDDLPHDTKTEEDVAVINHEVSYTAISDENIVNSGGEYDSGTGLVVPDAE